MIWLSTCTGVYFTIWFYVYSLSISAETNLPGPTGYSGIYIAFPLLRFQALLGAERTFRWIRFSKKWKKKNKKKSKHKKTPWVFFILLLLLHLLRLGPVRANSKEKYDLDIEECKMHLTVELSANCFKTGCFYRSLAI